MKRMSGLFVMIFLLIGTLGFVAAEEHETEVREAKEVGFFEDIGDRIGLAFTFNKELKIERILEMAEKRLAEAELLASESPEAYERAQERYDNLVARAEEILADIESLSDDVNDSIDEMGRIARIQDKFERHRAHSDEIYTRVLERFELNNASDEKIERFEMFYERALNRSYKMEARIIEKKSKFTQKYINLSEASDDDINRTIIEIEEREGLREKREDRKIRAEARVERVIDIKGRYIEKMRLRLENSDLSEEQRSRIEIRIEDAGENIEKFEVRIRERFEDGERRFEVRIRERFEDGELRTEIRVSERDNDNSARDALRDAARAEEDALKAEEDALKDAARAEEDALKAEEDALKNAEEDSQ